jgi:hypothetical protein
MWKILSKLAPILIEPVNDYRKMRDEKSFPQRAVEDKNSLWQRKRERF